MAPCPRRWPRPHFTTARATRKATRMRTIVGFENPAYAASADTVPDSTAAAMARTDAVRIGKASMTPARIAAMKIANRCHACGLRPSGGGTNQIASATARVTARAIRTRRNDAGRLATEAAAPADMVKRSATRQSRRVEDLLELFLGQDLFFTDELDDTLVLFQRFGGECGRLLITDDRVQRRHRADAVLDVMLEDVRVWRDSVDAVRPQGPRGIDQDCLALENDCRDNRLERIQLQLTRLGRHRHDQVIADDPVGDHVRDLRDDRIHLARHDGRAGLHGRQVDLAQPTARP